MSKRPLRDSFDDAFLGIAHVLRTQRNMRIHLAAAIAAISLARVLGVATGELVLVLFAAALVIVAEMLNTAVEAAVDVTAPGRHPLGLVAKNVAAGAVLVAALNAAAVGYLVLFRRLSLVWGGLSARARGPAVPLVLGCLALAGVAATAVRFRRGPTGLWLAAMPGAHTALAFAAGTAISLLTRSMLVALLALFVAALVAQARLAARLDNLSQVIMGALAGMFAAGLLFRLLGL